MDFNGQFVTAIRHNVKRFTESHEGHPLSWLRVLLFICDTVPDLSAYVRSGNSGSSPARAPPRIATASVASTRRGSDSDSAQRTNPLSAFDTRDVS